MIVTLIIILACVGTMTLMCYLAFVKGPRDLKRDKEIHDRYYNSLDPNSKYSQRECCGKDCGCHSNEKKLTKGPSGEEENWSSGDM